YKVLFVKSILVIVAFWIIIPLFAFLFTFAVVKIIRMFPKRKLSKKGTAILSVVLILSGFLEAFSAGMNNVANAVGPLVASGVLSVGQGTLYGGIFVAAGALLLGRRVLETNGKKITRYQTGEGILLSSTGAGLVIVSSIFGLPVPLTQITSSSIIGLGMAKGGPNIFHKHVVKKMLKVWVVSPFLSLSLSYLLVSLFLKGDYYSIFIMMSVLLASLGALSLMKAVKNESSSIHEQGGGI
ncbi:inorganic phosphate transporter, partial [Bacillus safensis]